jgi:hypothetical protein
VLLKRLHITPILLALLGYGLFQQSGDPSVIYHDSLGFSLLEGSNSSPVSYYIVRKFEDPAKQITAQNISKASFMSIGYGWGESSANPKNEDLFTKYEIAHCGYTPDTIIHHILYKGGFGCSPLDDLWKLAHKEYPFAGSTNVPSNQQNVNNPVGHGSGWARNMDSPSEGQIGILHNYGAVFFIDIIYGEKAFQLLHDMQDPVWVSRYTSS